MAAAFKVEYSGPNGRCPDCVIIFSSYSGEDVGNVAQVARDRLVEIRGGEWSVHDLTLHSMSYIGPWFSALAKGDCPCGHKKRIEQDAADDSDTD